MPRKKTRTNGRAHKATRLETTWRDAKSALRNAEGVVGKRVAAFARRSGVDTKQLQHRAELWRGRLDREGKKARKRIEARLSELQQRARQERHSLTRIADGAVARALGALNIPTRHEVHQLSRRVEQLSSRVATLRR
jgi:chaperonin cofactor prefoldin